MKLKKTYIISILGIALVVVLVIVYIAKQNAKEEARKDCLRWIAHDPFTPNQYNSKEDAENYMYCMSQRGYLPVEKDVNMLKAIN